LIQAGLSASDWKPIPLVGAGVELGKKRYREFIGKAEVMRTTRGSENVFVDCGFPPTEAENNRHTG
jgi:hypothetical protein